MELKHIKTERCPKCGAPPIKESVETGYTLNPMWNEVVKDLVPRMIPDIRQHISGGRWEHREFLCGLKVGFIPNFEREGFAGECVNDIEILKRERNRHEFIGQLSDLVEESMVDDEYKDRLLEHFETYFGLERFDDGT